MIKRSDKPNVAFYFDKDYAHVSIRKRRRSVRADSGWDSRKGRKPEYLQKRK
jgi:hypothetical protein